MEICVGISKIQKYAVSESGDTVEVVERPNGGLSVVLADGQSSGRGAKSVSTLVVRKVITLLAEGVRDGAAARAASDYLYTERSGKVSSTLNILSVDTQSGTVVITRNNPAAVILAHSGGCESLDEPSIPIGLYRGTRPLISEVALEPGLTVVMFTDGVVYAGSRFGESIDVPSSLQALLEDEDPSAQMIADSILAMAVHLDRGRPADDISVAVMRATASESDKVRRMTIRLPL